MSDFTAKNILAYLEKVFAREGDVEWSVSDNAMNFVFRQFSWKF